MTITLREILQQLYFKNIWYGPQIAALNSTEYLVINDHQK